MCSDSIRDRIPALARFSLPGETDDEVHSVSCKNQYWVFLPRVKRPKRGADGFANDLERYISPSLLCLHRHIMGVDIDKILGKCKIISHDSSAHRGAHLGVCTSHLNHLELTGYVMHQQFNILKPTGHVMRQQFNLLKLTGYVMHQQFNIQHWYALPALYLCVLYLSENKQRLVSLIS